MSYKVFIGYDPREHDAAEVCKYSILQNSTLPVEIEFLKLDQLRQAGIYTRPDDDLGSTQFTFSRFLVPYLCDYKGYAVFVDCDFVFDYDIRELFKESSPFYAVSVVKHDYRPSSTVKMDGKQQHQYPRKNWSSLMLFNCGHREIQTKLTPDIVNTESGQYLHRLEWIDDQTTIGSLDKTWNWLVNWYREPEDGKPKAIHYTEGGPWFENYRHCEYGAVYMDYYHRWRNSLVPTPSLSEFEMTTPEIKHLFRDILNYRVDPAGIYYPNSRDQIIKNVDQLNNNNVYAVGAENMDEISQKFENKGATFDPFLKSFIQGSGGQITVWDKVETSRVPIVVRGVTKRKQMAACTAAGRDYYYIDTGYFGNGRKKVYHRITKNAMQNIGPVVHRPRDRLAATGWQRRKFRPGSNILLAPPSQKLLAVYNIDLTEWIEQTVERLKLYTDRNIIIREKQGRSVRVTTDTIEMALEKDIHCLVTFSSIAAVEAVLYGKPAIVLGPSAAHSVCSKDCRDIENPLIPTLDEVEEWAAHLAYSQFTEPEMRDGTAWKILSENA